MPFDGSGNFLRVMNWVNDAAAHIKILATRHDSEDDNFAAGLTLCITKDGQSQPTANIPMNGKRIINLANPVNPQDAMTLAQMVASNIRYDVAQALTQAQLLQAHQNLAATMTVLPKSANYTLLPADRGKLLFVTGTMNLTLPAASAIGNDFGIHFRVSSGVLSLVPNGTDQIEGINATLPIPAGAQGMLWTDGAGWFVKINDRVPLQSKAANYTAVMGDNGGRLTFTAGATLALAAAATLKLGWSLTVVAPNVLNGVVIVDPNGAETIDGLATITIGRGQTVTIFCDGTNFVTNRPAAPVWETIVAASPAGSNAIAFLDLGDFRKLRLSGIVITGSDCVGQLQVSTNNGSSYLAGAADYTVEWNYGTSANVQNSGAGNSTFITIPITTALAGQAWTFQQELNNFNQALVSRGLNQSNVAAAAAGPHYNSSGAGWVNSTVARNAMRFQLSAGVFATGTYLTLEGMRG